MEKKFLKYFIIAVAVFALGLFYRYQIFSQNFEYPGDLIMIYFRDSGIYFILLRMVVLILLFWGFYRLWNTGKSMMVWLVAFTYSAFLLVDAFTLGADILRYKIIHEPWEAAFPMSMFFGSVEVIFNLIFVALSVVFLKYLRNKRIQILNFQQTMGYPPLLFR